MEAGVDRSAAGTEILALPAPAHARDNRGRRAFPANCPTKASTCYRHSELQATRKGSIADPASERPGRALPQASANLSAPTGDVTPNVRGHRADEMESATRSTASEA